MKIEKINDNQIRCTLTHADLSERHLKLSELAYGTEKAKSLFQDMMQQAAFEFGFEAEDIPLMIEAIPASSDSIVLIITKVEDPEEIDARFSKFSPAAGGIHDSKKQDITDKLEGAETLLNLLDKVKEKMKSVSAEAVDTDSEEQDSESTKSSFRLFNFGTIDSVLQASRFLAKIYDGANTLYKDPADDIYVLAITQSELSLNEFNSICNMLTEYGTIENESIIRLAFLEEHCETLIPENAIQKMASI